MLRILVRRPEGAATNQPRPTPWDCASHPRSSPERAKHGDAFVPPFQGFGHVRIPIPRALPWAFLFGPFRGKFQNSATSKRASDGRWPRPARDTAGPLLTRRVGMATIAALVIYFPPVALPITGNVRVARQSLVKRTHSGPRAKRRSAKTDSSTSRNAASSSAWAPE